MSVPDLDYTDVVLKSLVTDDLAATATADVDGMGTYTEAWRNRLIMFRVYVLICLEYASTADDPFSVKLDYYRNEFDRAKVQADRAATAPLFAMSIPLERA